MYYELRQFDLNHITHRHHILFRTIFTYADMALSWTKPASKPGRAKICTGLVSSGRKVVWFRNEGGKPDLCDR
jgi:hypothetical protein